MQWRSQGFARGGQSGARKFWRGAEKQYNSQQVHKICKKQWRSHGGGACPFPPANVLPPPTAPPTRVRERKKKSRNPSKVYIVRPSPIWTPPPPPGHPIQESLTTPLVKIPTSRGGQGYPEGWGAAAPCRPLATPLHGCKTQLTPPPHTENLKDRFVTPLDLPWRNIMTNTDQGWKSTISSIHLHAPCCSGVARLSWMGGGRWY